MLANVILSQFSLSSSCGALFSKIFKRPPANLALTIKVGPLCSSSSAAALFVVGVLAERTEALGCESFTSSFLDHLKEI